MPAISVTVLASAGGSVHPRRLSIGRWSAGFDHAALVAAKRSRADGYDLRMYHLTQGAVPVASISGANTADCRLVFNTVTTLAPSASDANYRVIFGDMGATLPTYAGLIAEDLSSSVTPIAVPALTLPTPGFSLDREDDHDVDEIGYPEVLSPRVSLRNQNDRPEFTINWRNISAEDWYEIRAFWNAYKGGAGYWNPPSWLSSTATERFRCVSLTATQHTRLSFSAAMVVERCAA